MAVSAFRTEVPGDCMPRPGFAKYSCEDSCSRTVSLICATYEDKVCDTNVSTYTRNMQKLDVMP